MSATDSTVYNFLSMGVVFPWVYLWGASVYPSGSVALALLIALILQLPISLASCFLATVLPVTGGDYVFQTRAFGRLGFVVVMSGLVGLVSALGCARRVAA